MLSRFFRRHRRSNSAVLPPGSEALLIFLIPLLPRLHSHNWAKVSENLDRTLASVLGSGDRNVRAIVIHHEAPESKFRFDDRVTFLLSQAPPKDSYRAGSADKYRKRREGAAYARAKKWTPGFFFNLDADDLVSNRLIPFLRAQSFLDCVSIEKGFILDTATGTARVRDRFYTICGSSFGSSFGSADLPSDHSDSGSLFTKIMSGPHQKIIERANQMSRFATSPGFPGILYITNHTESLRNRKTDRLRTNRSSVPSGPGPELQSLRAEFGLKKEIYSPFASSRFAYEEGATTFETFSPNVKHLTELEEDLLDGVLNEDLSFLEFGVSNATLKACAANAKSVVSVDSRKSHVSGLRQQIHKDFPSANAYISWVDLGPVDAHGTPQDEGNRGSWHRYAATPWEIAHKNGIRPDLVLIDGPFIESCFLLSLFMASPGCRIVVNQRLIRFDRQFAEFITPDSVQKGLAHFTVPRRINRLEIYRRLENAWESTVKRF